MGVSPGGTRSAERSRIRIASRADAPLPSSDMPTTVWSIGGGQAA